MPSGFCPDLSPEAEVEPHLSVSPLLALSHTRTTPHTASLGSPSTLCWGGSSLPRAGGPQIARAEAQAGGAGVAGRGSGKHVSLGQRKNSEDTWLWI